MTRTRVGIYSEHSEATHLRREKWGAELIENLRPPPIRRLSIPGYAPKIPQAGYKAGIMKDGGCRERSIDVPGQGSLVLSSFCSWVSLIRRFSILKWRAEQ